MENDSITMNKDELREHLGIFTREELKEINKQAIKEWMDEKFAALGMWSAKVIVIAALAALVTFMVATGKLK